MTITRNITRNITKPIIRNILFKDGLYDSDALAYFAAVEGAGGSFDLTSFGGYDSDFSSGVDGWIGQNAVLAGNTDSIGGRDDSLKVYATASTFSQFYRYSVVLGHTYHIAFDYFIPSGNTNVNGVRIDARGISTSHTNPVLDQWNSIDLIGEPTTSSGVSYVVLLKDGNGTFTGANSPDDDIIYIRNFRARDLTYATYTTPYVKQAHNELFRGLKADGVWSKIAELYLLCGKTFGGLTVKAKGTGSLTNNNFVTGDWVAAGSGAGLAGGTNEYLQTGFLPNSLANNSRGLAAYETVRTTGAFDWLIGSDGPATNEQMWSLQTQDVAAKQQYFCNATTGGPTLSSGATAGFWSGNSDSSTTASLYKNGTSVATSTGLSVATPSALELYLFTLNRNGAPTANYTLSRVSLFVIKQGLSATDELNLSTRVNAFMTAFGANVY